MEQKSYLIGSTKFLLKEYGDLTGFEEEEIERLMGIQRSEVKGQKSEININLTGYEVFPIILVPDNPQVDVNIFDWRHLTGKQVAEILTDFVVQKKTSQDTMADYMIELTKQKLQQSGTMKKSTANQETSPQPCVPDRQVSPKEREKK